MVEVDKDMVAADEFADFLAQVARKGDKTSVTKKVSAASTSAVVRADVKEEDEESKQEEKTPDDSLAVPLSELNTDASADGTAKNDGATGAGEVLAAEEATSSHLDVEVGQIGSGADEDENLNGAS